MVDNSTAGLVMVSGDAAITVTREERHQSALAPYTPAPGGERRVAVELTWCVIDTGKYKGQRAIEVRLDGRRVGELTHLMSQRYAPLVTRVNAHNARAGCEAVITREAKGLQLTLRLPRDPENLPASPVHPATVTVPVFSRRTLTRRRTTWLAGAAAAAAILVAACGASGDDLDPGASVTDETTTTTYDPPTTTTTTPTTTTPPPPPPTTTTVPPPPPPPTTQTPPKPPPQQQCDPNYSGCVPIASDVDCAGGSGNGPAYANGPVDVIGSDIYDLDRDRDGVACE